MSVLSLGQPHGARLEKEVDLPERIKNGGWKNIITIEVPGPKMEETLRSHGFNLVVIDHHEYTDLDRAHSADGKRLTSSLDQFLALMAISDEELESLGFEARLVHGVALFDRGFVWEMFKEGFSKEEAVRVIDYNKRLMQTIRPDTNEEKREELSARIWRERIEWHGFFILFNDTQYQVRSVVSLIAALEREVPTPLILVEPSRGFIYAQETDLAQKFFDTFGGFTFGQGNNWGFKNEPDQKQVTPDMVKEVILSFE